MKFENLLDERYRRRELKNVVNFLTDQPISDERLGWFDFFDFLDLFN